MNLIRTGGSWSGHERNCCFLNTGGPQFADASAVTGLDFLDDGRAVAVVDWDLDGDLDLWMSARTAPRLRFVRNDFISSPGAETSADSPSHDEKSTAAFVAIRLRGTRSNRDAIGARVELTCGDRKLARTLHAGDGYLAQSSRWLHFGLASAATIDSVTVRWPNGDREAFTGFAVGSRYLLVEGSGAAEEVVIPRRSVRLEHRPIPTGDPPRTPRLVLRDRLPLPELSAIDLEGNLLRLPTSHGGPTLISLWATWCAPCLVELQELDSNRDRLADVGMQVVALNVNGLGEGDSSTLQQARDYFSRKAYPFQFARADRRLLQKLELIQESVISLRPQAGQLPTSLLLDPSGRLAVIYTGKIDVDQVVADAQSLAGPKTRQQLAAFPFSGRWFRQPEGSSALLLDLVKQFQLAGLESDALDYAFLAADLATRERVNPTRLSELATLFYDRGSALIREGQFADASRALTEAARLRPEWPEARANLGSALIQLQKTTRAREELEMAVRLAPDLLQARVSLGLLLLQLGESASAASHLRTAIQIEPNLALAHRGYGLAMARLDRREDAIQSLRTAVRLDPNDRSSQQDLNTLLSGGTP